MKHISSKSYQKLAGHQILPPMDNKYQPKKGLEGPIRLRSGKIVWYDNKAGQYIGEDDIYLTNEDYEAHSNPSN